MLSACRLIGRRGGIPELFGRSSSILGQSRWFTTASSEERGKVLHVSDSEALRLEVGNNFASIVMDRPKVHNALSDVVIQEMRQTIRLLEGMIKEHDTRALFLRANGKSFSAGADLEWMKRAAGYDQEKNVADAMELSGMLDDLANFPIPTVALVQGPAFGGGVGMVSVCDVAIGVASAKFTLSEVKLGLLPATISPYVIRRIGGNNCRRYFLTAETFDAVEAQRIGLLHEVVTDAEALGQFEETLKTHFLRNGPLAMIESKKLIRDVEGRPIDENLRRETAVRLAWQRDQQECREGLKAFFDKQKPYYSL